MIDDYVPLKHLARLNPETLGDNTDPDRSFRYIDIATTGRGVLLEDPQPMTFAAAPSRARRVLRPGDTILSTVRTYLRAAWTVRGRDTDLIASTGFVSLRPRVGTDPRYLGWLAQADPLIEEVVARSVGVSYPAINPAGVGSIKVPCPPLAEQRAIADHLDRETARVDGLIAAKRRMAELLEERWLQTIHEATRGADVPSPRRETGLDWLGSVPSAWEVMALKRLARVRRGASPRPIDDPIYFDPNGEFAWVRISDVSASDTYLERTTQKLSTLGSSISVRLMPGELFLSIAGTVGKPIITRIKCCIHDGFVYFSGLRLNPKYLYYLFAAGRLYLGLGKLGTQLNLNTDTVGSIRVPVPEPVEQERIVARLDKAGAHFAALRGALNQQLALLQEHRTAVVTTAICRANEVPDAA